MFRDIQYFLFQNLIKNSTPIPKDKSANPNCNQRLKPSSANVVNPQKIIGNPEMTRIIPKTNPLRFKAMVFLRGIRIRVLLNTNRIWLHDHPF